MTNINQSMPEILNNKEEQNWEEEWEVITNTKGKYILSKMQAIVLKQAIATGNRGTIMFETFAIAIPYIVEFYRVRRFLKDTKQLPAQASEPEYKPIDLKIFEEWKKKVYEKLGKKYKI